MGGMKTPKTSKPVTVAQRIAARRAKKQWTLREVAAKAKLTYQTVFRTEHGGGDLQTISTVLRVLGFTRAERAKLVAEVAAKRYA